MSRNIYNFRIAVHGFIAIALLLTGSRRDYRSESESAVVDGPVHAGIEIQVDLPADQHVRNFGAPKDGKGLCVFASMSMAARWHHVRALESIINQVQEGGGWPEKVTKIVSEHAPGLDVVQYEGTDPAILDKALAEDRPACVTYGYGERYKMDTIYHMVMLVYLDSKNAAILDNNFPGTYEWMSRDEFLRRWVHPGGKGWAYVMLAAPPPPPPHN
jgi:hypothetical protein